MRPLLDRLRSGDTVLGDGAWGTMLMDRGLDPGQAPEVFNLTRPEVLEDIARLYLDAGAEIITTNTFGASPPRLRQSGLEGQADAINRVAVEVARRVAGDRAYVSGSVGSCGHLLRPYGEADPVEIAAGFTRQIRALVDAGVDLLWVETMTDLAEAILAVRAARDVDQTVPIVATMTFRPTRRGPFTMMGNSIEQVVAGLSEAGADVLGSNCGSDIQAMVEIAREFRARTERPVAIRSNAGLPEHQAGKLVYPHTPAIMGAHAGVLADLGVRLIGGCCGVTPAHVRAMRRAVDERRRPD